MVDNEPREDLRWWTVNAIRRSGDTSRSYGFVNKIIAEQFRAIQGELIGPPDISGLSAHRTTGGDNKEVLYSDAIALPVREILFNIADVGESNDFPTVAMLSAEIGFHRRVVERMVAQVIDEEGFFAGLQGNDEPPPFLRQITKKGGVEVGYTPIVAEALKTIANDLKPIPGWVGIMELQKNKKPHRHLGTWKRGIEVVRRGIDEKDRSRYCRVVVTHSGENMSFSPDLIDLAEKAIIGGLEDVRTIDELISERDKDIIGTGFLSEQTASHPTLPIELVSATMERFRLSPGRALTRLESIIAGLGISADILVEAVLSNDFSSNRLLRARLEASRQNNGSVQINKVDTNTARIPRYVGKITKVVNELANIPEDDILGLVAYLIWYRDPEELNRVADSVLGITEREAMDLVFRVMDKQNLEPVLENLIRSLDLG